MELELNKQEIFLLLKSVEDLLETFDDDDDEGIQLAIRIKAKLKNAFDELAKVD